MKYGKVIGSISLAGALFLAGCGDSGSSENAEEQVQTETYDASVNVVRNGVMSSYPQGSIGAVFDSQFNNPSWRTEKDGWKTFVVFEGEITERLHDNAVSKLKLENNKAMSFYVGPKHPFRKKYSEILKGNYTNSDEDMALWKEHFVLFQKEACWPVGDIVQFRWLLHADGQSFEFDGAVNDYWAHNKYKMDKIWDIIYN